MVTTSHNILMQSSDNTENIFPSVSRSLSKCIRESSTTRAGGPLQTLPQTVNPEQIPEITITQPTIGSVANNLWIAFGSFLSKTVLFYLQPAAKEGPYSGQPVKVSSRKIVRGAKAKKEIISCSRPVVSSYTYKRGEECQLCALGPLYDLGEHKVLIHPGNTKAYLVTKKEHLDVDPLEDIDIFGENLNMLSELMKITPMTGFVWAESARNPQGKSEHPYIGFCVADADFISWDENNFSLEVRDTVGGKVYQIEMVMSLGTEDIDEFLNWFEDNVPELPNNKRWKFNGYVCESRLVATLSISNTIAQRSEEEVKNPEIPPPKTLKDHIVSCPRCNEKHEHQCTEDDKGCKVKCINPLCQDQAVRSDIVKVKAKTIKEQSDEAAEQLHDATSDIGKQTKRIDQIKIELNQIASSVGDLKGELGNLRGRITSFEQDVKTFREEIMQMKSDFKDFMSKIESRLSALENRNSDFDKSFQKWIDSIKTSKTEVIEGVSGTIQYVSLTGKDYLITDETKNATYPEGLWINSQGAFEKRSNPLDVTHWLLNSVFEETGLRAKYAEAKIANFVHETGRSSALSQIVFPKWPIQQ